MSTHPGELAARARDQWPLAMLREARGDVLERPLAVAFPRSTEDVATVVKWARETGTPVVPRGGGSGLVGGAQAVRGGIVLDLSQMREVLGIDDRSMVVEAQTGIRGDRLEGALEKRRLTLGPQAPSLANSSLGGWLATGAVGEASTGSMEDLVLGLTVVLADGSVLRLPDGPPVASGADLRRLFIGSEGTLGIITAATVLVSRIPEDLRWLATRPHSFEEGLDTVRWLAQGEGLPFVIGLFDHQGAEAAFGELGHAEGPLLIVGVDGDRKAEEVGRTLGVGDRSLGDTYGPHWWAHRFDAGDAYRRAMGPERALGSGVVLDTLETAALWSRLGGLYRTVSGTLDRHAESVGCRIAHASRSGASLSLSFRIRAADDSAAADAYLRCWRDAARATHEAGGSIKGAVGLLKAPFIEQEIGQAGVSALRALKSALDPTGILNPGKLLPRGG